MHRRTNLTHPILTSVVVLGLTLLMVVAEAQAQIAFESDRDWDALHFEIYVMDTDGGNQRNLSNNRGDDRQPSWSPDGKQIAFMSDRGGPQQICVMNADGANQRSLSNNDFKDSNPSWSQDGKRIAYVSQRAGAPEIYVMNADGGNPQNLINNPHRDTGPAWLNSPLSVSPAGKQFTMWGRLKQVDH